MNFPIIDWITSMSDVLKSIVDKRNRAWESAKGLLEAAEGEKREFSAEEEVTYDRHMEEISKLDKRSKQYEEAEGRTRDFEASVREIPKGDSTKSEDSNRLLEYFRGQGPRGIDVRAPGLDGVSFRDLSKFTSAIPGVATPTAGGNTVETSFVAKLYEHMIESSGILQAGPTVLRTSSGEALQIPKTTSYSAATILGEGAAITESDPVFGQLTLDAYKYGFGVQVSHELINDTSVDLLGFLARQSGRAVGNAFGAHAITGTGTGQPNGLVTGSSLGVTGANTVAGVFTADNLIDLQFSVIAPYRNSSSAAWLVKDSTLGAIRKLREGAGTGAYLWQPSIQVGVPDTLLGKPVYTDPNVAAVGVSAKSVIFGDISAYYVRLVEHIRFERSDDFAFMNDLVTFRCLMRADGDLVDTSGAVKHFVGGTA